MNDPVVGLHAKGGAVDTLCQWLADGDKQLKVVSIVGVGGIGKTTLAKQLWLEKKLGDFDCRAFVRTAKKPDMRRILRSILVQVRPHQPPNTSGVHDLIHDINEHLQNKRYFLIIDDLWATSVWDVVSDAFPEGNHCSRIVTTTEIEDVARACCSYPSKDIFKMEPLNVSNSKELFTNGVLGSREEDYRQFDEASDEIVRRCAGLPLAIISVASVLASQREADAVENREQTRGRWKGVHDFVYSIIEASVQSYRHINPAQLHNKSASGDRVQDFVVNSLPANTTSDEIMKQVLIFVYSCLSSCLQTCLLHLSMYPENYKVLKEDITKQWVVEGFICAPTDNGKMKVAQSYFDKLVSMGLIQDIDVDNSDGILYYAVHHLVHDFITSKSKEENFVNVIDYSQRTIRLANKVSHLSLQFGSATYATPPACTTTGLSQVRSLAYTGLSSCLPLISEFKLIRVLILHIWDDQPSIDVDLWGISELLLLRYLQVTCSDTVHLPDQMQGLKHLETLEINAGVAAVPSDLFHLQSLLHLRLGGGTELPDVTGILRNVTVPSAAILLDESSSPPNSVMAIELLPPICIIPEWFGQLNNLCILKVVVGELLRDDIHILGGLPALTVLTLFVQRQTTELISFAPGAFYALEYFEFRCGVLLLMFEEGAMPNLQRIKLGFNSHRGEQYGRLLVGIEHLSNVQEISGIIGSTVGAEEYDLKAAESAFKDASGKHPSNVSIKRSGIVVEEYGPLEIHHSFPSTSNEICGNQKQESQEDIKQNAANNFQLIDRTTNKKGHASVELLTQKTIRFKIADITSKRWNSSAFKVLSKFQGINSMSLDKKGLLKVVAHLDPEVILRALRKAKFNAQIISVGPHVQMDKPKGRQMPESLNLTTRRIIGGGGSMSDCTHRIGLQASEQARHSSLYLTLLGASLDVPDKLWAVARWLSGYPRAWVLNVPGKAWAVATWLSGYRRAPVLDEDNQIHGSPPRRIPSHLELDSAKVAAVIAALRLEIAGGAHWTPTVVQHRANTFNSDSSGDDDDEDPSDGYMCYPPISFLETGDAPLFLTGSTDSARPGDGLYRLSDVHDNPWILREGITTVAGPCELTNETTMTWVMRLKITTKLVCLIKQQLLEQNRELSEECFAKVAGQSLEKIFEVACSFSDATWSDVHISQQLTVFETLVDVLFNIQDLHFIRSGEVAGIINKMVNAFRRMIQTTSDDIYRGRESTIHPATFIFILVLEFFYRNGDKLQSILESGDYNTEPCSDMCDCLVSKLRECAEKTFQEKGGRCIFLLNNIDYVLELKYHPGLLLPSRIVSDLISLTDKYIVSYLDEYWVPLVTYLDVDSFKGPDRLSFDKFIEEFFTICDSQMTWKVRSRLKMRLRQQIIDLIAPTYVNFLKASQEKPRSWLNMSRREKPMYTAAFLEQVISGFFER
ncbi:disease resistance protein RGA5-like isoform X2 [Hordeum vulgare subsp. vulgare]|uniref:disease resistance protein RGA5-like isoform X2 n=1 Tax=Hordeum vulgare subsp. vulgare TaxID=112509 RepID=UPI001D1A37D6|nr:disease resistance protein RGA5-like isoform X2 [Hordeum vulgare subsp. vulgare]